MYALLTKFGIMIDYLKHMAIFSRVAEKGSFSAAAQSLGIAPSRVSEAVTKLEHFAEATLFTRTTRKVSLTSEGRKLFAYTSTIVENAQQGIDALNGSMSVPSGTLRISVPSYLTCSPTMEVIGAFGAKYGDVQIDISSVDTHVDPIHDGFDVCIQAGKSENPSIVSQKLSEMERVIVTGRDYFASKPPPHHPDDLKTWDWITYRYKKRNFKLASNGGKRATLKIDLQSRFQVNSFDGLVHLTKQNLGVAVVPLDLCRDEIADGYLVRLLDDWRLSKVQHFVSCANTKGKNSLVSVFIRFLSDEIVKNDT